jgi:hypothetical protein
MKDYLETVIKIVESSTTLEIPKTSRKTEKAILEEPKFMNQTGTARWSMRIPAEFMIQQPHYLQLVYCIG